MSEGPTQRDSPPPPPPPVPPTPPPPVLPYGRRVPRDGAFEQYHTIAETVGFMPSVRWKDNLIQGLIVVLGTIIGAALGAWFSGGELGAAIVGGIAGLVVFGILSGIVLMVIGWVRALRR